MTLKELFDGIKAGSVDYDRFQKWNDNVTGDIKKKSYAKAQKEFEGKQYGEISPETEARLKRLAELEEANELLTADSQEKKALELAIKELKRQNEEKDKVKENEIQRMKLDNETYRKMFLDKSLLTTAGELVRKLNLKDPEYAIHDLVRDGVLKAEEVRDEKTGNIIGTNYKLDFSYEDDKTKQKISGGFDGNEKDLSRLVDGLKILATNPTASYDRIKKQYPIQEGVPIGAGRMGGQSGGSGGVNISNVEIDDNAAIQSYLASQKK